ncbi:unnamed protein product [Lactuca virosa]|uniref:Uncharacterized protein n=1 Tax=Lactuca virosa TaxID=75947 RepID=A0AAU9P1C8_9ASTR|nr:unnamed protein product [Lactuca virosa]
MCHSRVSPHRLCLIFPPPAFSSTHIRISPSYRRDGADDHRPGSDLGSHDGTGTGYVPLSSSKPRISLMLPQSQPSSHRQLELLSPFRLLLKRRHRTLSSSKRRRWHPSIPIRNPIQTFSSLTPLKKTHHPDQVRFPCVRTAFGGINASAVQIDVEIKTVNHEYRTRFRLQLTIQNKREFSLHCRYSALLTTPSLCQEGRLKELQDKLEAVKMEQPQGHDEL